MQKIAHEKLQVEQLEPLEVHVPKIEVAGVGAKILKAPCVSE